MDHRNRMLIYKVLCNVTTKENKKLVKKKFKIGLKAVAERKWKNKKMRKI